MSFLIPNHVEIGAVIIPKHVVMTAALYLLLSQSKWQWLQKCTGTYYHSKTRGKGSRNVLIIIPKHVAMTAEMDLLSSQSMW
jgi:hypothetical protein